MNKFSEPFLRTPHEIVITSNDSIWPSAIGAFFGAFFAFIFGLITFYVQKRLERYWKHKNAVVEIEQLLNDHLNTISGNRFLLEGAAKTLKGHNMTFTLLTQFRLPEDMNLRLGNLELLNRYADYKEPVEKLNHGMNSWQGLNDRFQQNVIANPGMPVSMVHKNMEHIQGQGETLIKFLNGLDQDTQDLLSYVRIYMRKDKHFWSLWFHKEDEERNPLITKKEVKEELNTLKEQVKKISEESKKRIDKITQD